MRFATVLRGGVPCEDVMSRMYRMLGAKHAYEGERPLYPNNQDYMSGYRGESL